MITAPPTEFEEYRLLRPIGRGSMGQVYIAQDTLLDRKVAIKFLATGKSDPQEAARFLVEARAIARLSHPNVVTIYRVGQVDGLPFFVSELVHGESLDRWQRPLPPAKVLSIGIDLARGLAAAHLRGVLHRDIKPANSIVDEAGTAKLLDFGLAKFLTEEVGNIKAPPKSRPGITRARSRPGLPQNRVDETLPLQQGPNLPVPAQMSPGSLSLTKSGVLLGTPLYMAPEIWLGMEHTRQADVYSLGALLYELCSGVAPHHNTPLALLPEQVTKVDAPPLSSKAPEVDPRLCAIIDRCLQRDPALRFPSGEALRDALEGLKQDPLEDPVPVPEEEEDSPYRGLLPFTQEHARVFFGRSGDARAVLHRLSTLPFVLITGDSGTGKSSLMLAGVLPWLRAGHLGNSRQYATAALVPSRRPLFQLCAALSPILGVPRVDTLVSQVQADPASLSTLIRGYLSGAANRGLALFVDQMEELVTLSSPEEAARVSEALGGLLPFAPGLLLCGTARSDFLSRLSALPVLGKEVPQALFLLPALSEQGIREAISGPAKRVGYTYESQGMVDELAASVRGAQGALPLLQFALDALFALRDPVRKVIPSHALASLGGVSGALAQHADSVLASMNQEQRTHARRIFGQLVTSQGTRACLSEEELVVTDPSPQVASAARAALAILVRGRLLCVRGDGQVEIAHEALLSGWKTLADWLDRDRDQRIFRARLDGAASEWQRLGKSKEALYRDRQLKEVLAKGLSPKELPPLAAAFLAASLFAQRRRRVRVFLLASFVPLLTLVLYMGITLRARAEKAAQVQKALGSAQALHKEAQLVCTSESKERTSALAAFDAQDPKAEELYDQVLRYQALCSELRTKAEQELERALLVDGSHQESKDLLSRILYEHIVQRSLFRGALPLLSETDRALYFRLALYDRQGTYLDSLRAPATVALQSGPNGRLVIFRYQRLNQGPLEKTLHQESTLGKDERRTLNLPPGSYLLIFQAEGKTELRVPLLLAPKEQVAVTLAPPSQAEIPKGFVYIPAGRFVFGTTTGERVRKSFFRTVPAHEVDLPAFLIERTETTYGQWLGFLRSLPQAERQKRSPRAEGFHGYVSLQEEQGRFRLQMRPTTTTYEAWEGDPIHYPGRTKRKSQDWLKMPVSGISWDDAASYLVYLDQSGQVKGARFCTETEWERAAKGADDREFPNGDRLGPNDANWDETYGKDPLSFGPDQVGTYPASESPFGVQDLAGNIMEWVAGSIASQKHVARGGAYYFGDITNQSTNRTAVEPTLRNLTQGLRVCAPAP